jgi:hypothetical protein
MPGVVQPVDEHLDAREAYANKHHDDHDSGPVGVSDFGESYLLYGDCRKCTYNGRSLLWKY